MFMGPYGCLCQRKVPSPPVVASFEPYVVQAIERLLLSAEDFTLRQLAEEIEKVVPVVNLGSLRAFMNTHMEEVGLTAEKKSPLGGGAKYLLFRKNKQLNQTATREKDAAERPADQQSEPGAGIAII